MAPIGSSTQTQKAGAFTPGNSFAHRYVKKKMDNLLWGNLRNTDRTSSSRSRNYYSEPSRKEVLEAKEARVNKTWNKIKNFFGYGEKMTGKEQVELDCIRHSEERWKRLQEKELQ